MLVVHNQQLKNIFSREQKESIPPSLSSRSIIIQVIHAVMILCLLHSQPVLCMFVSSVLIH